MTHSSETVAMMHEVSEKHEAMERIFRLNALKLHEEPVAGRFDVAHLREIHRRIFDLPPDLFNESTYYPGEFRHPIEADDVARGVVWQKNREYPLLRPGEERVRVMYSNMDDAAIARLESVLKDIDFIELSQMDKMEFTERFSQLYAELDFAHPFMDGNSRTLREFTRQVANQVGYDVRWDIFTDAPLSREVLYGARDLAVTAVGFDLAEPDDTMTLIALSETNYELRGFKPLDLLLLENNFVSKLPPENHSVAKWESKADVKAFFEEDPFSDGSVSRALNSSSMDTSHLPNRAQGSSFKR